MPNDDIHSYHMLPQLLMGKSTVMKTSKSTLFHTCAPKGGMFKFGSGAAVGGKVAGGKGLSVGRS